MATPKRADRVYTLRVSTGLHAWLKGHGNDSHRKVAEETLHAIDLGLLVRRREMLLGIEDQPPGSPDTSDKGAKPISLRIPSKTQKELEFMAGMSNRSISNEMVHVIRKGIQVIDLLAQLEDYYAEPLAMRKPMKELLEHRSEIWHQQNP